jgi:endonuclease G
LPVGEAAVRREGRPQPSGRRGAGLTAMSVLTQQIAKAERRAAAIDLPSVLASGYDKTPAQMAAPQDIEARRRFLQQSLGDPARSQETFERIIEGNELQPVNYLELGMLAGRSVCRIKIIDQAGVHRGWGTGFLIAPEVLLTNNHVFPAAATARGSIAQFDVELDVFGDIKPTAAFALDPDRLFHTTAALDFAVVAVNPTGREGQKLSAYGFLPLIGSTGKVLEGEWLTLIQHPEGKRKQVCVRENRFLKRTDDVLWYSTDTLGGSSGSPVFNNDWQVVALHHMGVPEEKDGRIQTLDGRDYDEGRDREDAIKWVANEGIRVSRIVDTLAHEAPGHPLLADIFNMTPARARQVTEAMLAATPRATTPPGPIIEPEIEPRSAPAMSRSVTVTLDISDDGRVSVRGSAPAATEAWLEKAAAGAKPAATAAAEYDVPFDANYKGRDGFDPGFLDLKNKKVVTPLPILAPDLLALAEPLLPPYSGHVLDYDGFSLVMHSKRRMAMYTAANLDGGNRFALGRPDDVWRIDPRIRRAAQIGPSYYERNEFDRGHLTRREDMEYGDKPETAIARANDTCHYCNSVPQHSGFNRNKELWQGLERHVLEGAISANRFAAQVFTGPILDERDPIYPREKEIQYPLRFWKIAVALNSSNRLFAAAFLLDQSEVIAKLGIEAAVAVPFAAFKTFQVPITEIEELTGLTFPCTDPVSGAKHLRDVDPLNGPAGRRRSRAAAPRLRLNESAGIDTTPPGYVPLDDGAAIVR